LNWVALLPLSPGLNWVALLPLSPGLNWVALLPLSPFPHCVSLLPLSPGLNWVALLPLSPFPHCVSLLPLSPFPALPLLPPGLLTSFLQTLDFLHEMREKSRGCQDIALSSIHIIVVLLAVTALPILFTS
jgi:hypothetical protein